MPQSLQSPASPVATPSGAATISPRPPARPEAERQPLTRLAEAPRRRLMSHSAAWMWLAFAVLCVGPALPLEHYLTPRSGLGYWLGILGGSLMLALLIYPLRKRAPWIAAIGSPQMWFKIHMALGIIGPLCIVYHCVYRLGATNSNVAFVSMAIVATSGIVGRYLYARIHAGLYGQKTTLSELQQEAERLHAESGGTGRLLPELTSRLAASEQRIGRTVPFLPRALTALWHWRIERMRLRRYIHETLRKKAQRSGPIAQHGSRLADTAFRYADARLAAARRVAEFHSCEQLFSLWHVLHLPLFGLLIVAAIVHIVAVNIY